MNKAKKIIWAFLIVSVLAIAALYLISLKTNEKPAANLTANSSIILYYSITCPHCKVVEDYIKNNSIDSKMNLTQKESSGQNYVLVNLKTLNSGDNSLWINISLILLVLKRKLLSRLTVASIWNRPISNTTHTERSI